MNFGQSTTPTPFGPTAIDATSLNLGPHTGAASSDVTTQYNTLKSSFDSAIATHATAFELGETNFLATLATLETALYAAIDVWAGVIGKPLEDAKNGIAEQMAILQDAQASIVDEAFALPEWLNFMGTYYSGLLLYLGAILEGTSGRYAFASGIAPSASPAGTGTPTGDSPFGTSSLQTVVIEQSLKRAGEPFVKYGYKRFAVRATKSGVEERNDAIFALEINGANVAQELRPNLADLKSMYFDGNILRAQVTVSTAGQKAEATYVQLHVVTRGSAITLSAPQQSATLSADLGGYKQADISYTFLTTGWFDVAVVARTASNNQYSESYTRYAVHYDSATAPSDADNITASVRRNFGIRPEEAS